MENFTSVLHEDGPPMSRSSSDLAAWNDSPALISTLPIGARVATKRAMQRGSFDAGVRSKTVFLLRDGARASTPLSPRCSNTLRISGQTATASQTPCFLSAFTTEIGDLDV